MSDAVLTFTASHTGWLYRGRQRGKQGQLVSDDGTWPANGIALSAATFGMSRLDSVEVEGMALNGTGGALASLAGWDKAAGALMLFEQASSGDEFAESNLTSMDGYIYRVTGWGA